MSYIDLVRKTVGMYTDKFCVGPINGLNTALGVYVFLTKIFRNLLLKSIPKFLASQNISDDERHFNRH